MTARAKARPDIFRHTLKVLTMAGMPLSEIHERTGIDFANPAGNAEAFGRFQALTRLVLAYQSIADGEPRCFDGLTETIEEAAAHGVLYEPPGKAYDAIRQRAGWQRAARAFEARRGDRRAAATPHPLEAC